MNVLNRIPASLADAAILNQPEGCEHSAWRRAQALEVLQHFKSSDVAVLGGDVLVKDGRSFRHALDNWTCDHQVGEGWTAYATRSRREAEEYLTRYPEQGDVAYAFVLQDKPSARDLLISGSIDAGA